MTNAPPLTPLVERLRQWPALISTDHGVHWYKTSNIEPIAIEAADALERLERELENERQKVAGCSTAAFGYWKESDGLHQDYECAAIHDTAALYVKCESAERELAAATKDEAETQEALQERNQELWAENIRVDALAKELAAALARVAELEGQVRAHAIRQEQARLDAGTSGLPTGWLEHHWEAEAKLQSAEQRAEADAAMLKEARDAIAQTYPFDTTGIADLMIRLDAAIAARQP